MRTQEFDYPLHPSSIAQYPSPQRGETALMVLHRRNGKMEHRIFREITRYLNPGDLLVMNDTRVIPARLIGNKETGGRVEILLIPCRNGTEGIWEALIKGSGRVRRGTRIRFEQGYELEVEEIEDGRAKIRLQWEGEMVDTLKRIGHIPLPPYIKREVEPLDSDRYQTIFAERDGSIASPTAGLHFTHSLLQSLRENKVDMATITLHIGIGTFAPVKGREIEDHRMEAEWIEISVETAKKIEETKSRRGKVIAIGTTTTRALESFHDGKGGVRPGHGMTSLFIYPPYRFHVMDGLVTNFHLPKSTLIMMVSAFAGKDLLMKAYHEAIERKYRFYSYGDAMLIL